MAALNIPQLSDGESRALALAVEGQWAEFTRDAAVNLATFTTYARELTPAELAEVFSTELLGNAQALLDDFREMFTTVRALDNGGAVLVPWKAQDSDVIHLAVVRRDTLPAGTQLAYWPIVIGLAMLSTGVVLYEYFDSSVQEMRERNATLRTRLLQRAIDMVPPLQQSNPALAAKVLDTAAKASAVEVAAAQNPKSWLDSFFAGVGGAAGSGIGIVAVLAALYFALGRGRRRAA